MLHSSRDELLSALRDVLPGEPGIAVVHSSLPALLPPADLKPPDAVYAISELAKAGWTIALPAFTFSFCAGKPFHAHHSASETGILADWVLRQLASAQRTPHPIYSFVVIGPRAQEIIGCPSTTTFGDDSPFGLFEASNAVLVALGCGIESFTQLHRCEQKAVVPYRYFKSFSGIADYGSGPKRVAACMYVRDLQAAPNNDYSRAVAALIAHGSVTSRDLWRGQVAALHTRELMQTCGQLLADDPFALLNNGPQVARYLAAVEHEQSQPPFRIALLGTGSLHGMQECLANELSLLMPRRLVEFQIWELGRRVSVDETSRLHTFKPDLQILCAQWAGATVDEAAVRQYAALIAQHARVGGGWTIVHTFADPVHDTKVPMAATLEQLSRYNVLLTDELADVPQLVFMDSPTAVVATDLARRWAGAVLSILGKTARVVVVDPDNTLWKAVTGEDGVAGIATRRGYPESAFREFQSALKEIKERGVRLAICSNHFENDSLAANELPSMILRTEDFAARRINWLPKSTNIQQLAMELDVDLESVVYVDANPVEREAVRRTLPAIRVMDLPDDPALYAQTLRVSPFLANPLVRA